jgi:L-fucose isomerase and related proteins
MRSFVPVYVPVGVGTFHMESARACFEASRTLLLSIDPFFVCPDGILLTPDDVEKYLAASRADLVVFQNVTFANAAYVSEVLRACSCPVVLWALREPVIDGGRLRLNSLTGAFSAANTMRAFGKNGFPFVYGMPSEPSVQQELSSAVAAARIRHELKDLRIAAIGHTPEGFGFGRALDTELLSTFGVRLISIEARELISRAKGYADEDCEAYDRKTESATEGLDQTPARNRLDHARLYRAYTEFVRENRIGALASRCWPDFFTDFGTPVCTVLSLLNDDGVAAACEADLYGALSMWIGMRLSKEPVFFGDPVSLDEEENTITFWHCGAAACSLARKDTGAAVGVHPNRRIGPAMDFGCGAFENATVFRVGREPDGSFRFFLLEGSALDKPKQFTGTSIVIRTDAPCRGIVEKSVEAGFEPHFAVMKGRHAKTLETLARYYGFPVFRF